MLIAWRHVFCIGIFVHCKIINYEKNNSCYPVVAEFDGML